MVRVKGASRSAKRNGTQKIAIPPTKAHRILNTGATVLVSSAHGRKRAVLAVAWQMPASSDPPLIAVSIGQGRYSHDVIVRARAFVVNVPTAKQLHLVRIAGTVSGWEKDKFEGSGLTPEPSVHVEVPRIAECPAHLECRLVRRHRCGDHSLFVGEVLGAFATKEIFDGRLRVEGTARTLHHLGGSHFHLPGRIVEM